MTHLTSSVSLYTHIFAKMDPVHPSRRQFEGDECGRFNYAN
jgi:hypothetical protein